jgi:hypothetical protein
VEKHSGRSQREIAMELREAEELRKGWERKGNPPCKHEKREKEYYLGTHTGDKVCTTCGKTV